MPVAVGTLYVGLLHNMQNMVSFDVAQDREPVERPFHDLWRNGGETEKRPLYPPRVMEFAPNFGSHF